MSYQDKSLTCSDCGQTFTFRAEDQEFFHSKGFTNEPKRCPDCRRARKAGRDNYGSGHQGAPRQMFTTVCSECGKTTEVPFEPRGDRPVYCSDCYRNVRTTR